LSLIALSVVKDDGALPASFLVLVEFSQVGDDVLARGPTSVRTLSTRA